MSGAFTIRRAGPEDVRQIDDLTQRAYRKWVPRLGRKPLPMTVDYGQAVLDHRIDLLSDENGTTVGLLEVHPLADHLVIENVAVDPAAQGLGYGRALMAQAEKIAHDLGLDLIRLYTNKLLVENVAFYESLGYVHDGEEPFKGGFIVHMRKQLGAFDPAAFLVARNLLPIGTKVTVERLAGGYQNDVFRAQGPGVDWVVKRFRPLVELSLFANDAVAEARALKLMGLHRLAPRFIDFVEDVQAGPVLIYEFYDGPTWRGGDVMAVAHMLARLHALPADGFRQVPTAPRGLLDQGTSFVDVLADAARQSDLLALRPAPIDVPPGPTSVIHTDAGPGNIVLGADGLRLIDWQCPALGDAAEDIAAFLSPAFQILYDCPPLREDQRAAFLAAYGDSAAINRFRKLEPFFNWRMAAYCAMRVENYRLPRPKAADAYERAYSALIDLLRREGAR